ncbi:MAG: isochorismatase family protein [Anaerolineales bacterium]|jgi:nicotinamidase-related amidase|nr:isochorismatase family protein [Anaerolineales bacterium]
MATVREGNKSVLVVVDAQVGVLQGTWKAPEVIKNIAITVETARRQGVPVVWVQHSDEELAYGSPEWQLAPELRPAEGETRIHKQFNSSFEQTPLEETLASLGATHLVLAGAATNWCIRATAYGALDRGYDLTLIKDAHTTGAVEFANGETIKAEDIILELNNAMTWLSYPGRVNGVAAAGEVDFSTPGGADQAVGN